MKSLWDNLLDDDHNDKYIFVYKKLNKIMYSLRVRHIYPEFRYDKAHRQLVHKISTEVKNKLSNTHK